MAANTLLICFDFPPNQGIGGRRWAKLAKALAGKGINLWVIKADPITGNQTSPWTSDIDHEQIHVVSLPRTYPEILSNPGKSLLDRIRYRIARLIMKNKVNGTIYDLAIGWDKLLIPKAIDIIERESIQNLIVTGAPFNLFDYAAEIKRRKPEINLILDYRDPWLTAVNYGIPHLKYKDFLHEKLKQRRALLAADHVTCPNPFMLREIHGSDDLRPIHGEYFETPHFYDEDDIKKYLKSSSTREKKNIRIVYGGTLYLGLESHFASLNIALDRLQEEDPEVYGRLHIELYSKDQQFSHWFDKHREVIQLSPPIGKELFKRIAVADACFIFLAHHNKDYRTTKFFEILPFSKPLIYMGDEGFVAQFIEDQNLGIVLRNPASQFVDLIHQIESNELKISSSYNYRAHSLKNIGKIISDRLK